MEEQTQEQLYAQLGTVDESLGFLLLIILSVCLSWMGVTIQRQGLYDILAGKRTDLPDISSLRLTAGTLVTAALTFFFGLALDTWAQAGPAERPSAQVNLWASLFVLAAALLRLYDLTCLQSPGEDADSEPLPD